MAGLEAELLLLGLKNDRLRCLSDNLEAYRQQTGCSIDSLAGLMPAEVIMLHILEGALFERFILHVGEHAFTDEEDAGDLLNDAGEGAGAGLVTEPTSAAEAVMGGLEAKKGRMAEEMWRVAIMERGVVEMEDQVEREVEMAGQGS